MVTPSHALEFVLLVRHRFTFSTHDVLYPWRSLPTTFSSHDLLYLTSLQCLLQLATRPKASNGAVPTIIYELMRRREGRLLHLSELQTSLWNKCQVKSVFKSVTAYLFGILSVSYFRSQYTLMIYLSLQPGGMGISLDRTIVLQHCICSVFASLGLQRLVGACIGIQWCWFSSTSRSHFNMALASTETIVYCRLDCRLLAGRYAWCAVSGWDFSLFNDEHVLFPEHGHGILFGESLSEQLSDRCQSLCQRAAVRGLLSEWLLSEYCIRDLLSEWLLSQCLLSECFGQRASVRVVAVRELLSGGFWQSGCCQSQSQRLNYSIRRYWSSIQLETIQKDKTVR